VGTRTERIVGWLQIKDAARFKTGMKSAARSVREFGEDTAMTSAQLDALNRIEASLERQTIVLSTIMQGAKHQINDVGNEAVKTAAKMKLLDGAMEGIGSHIPRQLTSWAFWKDRLSLTRGEIMTTAITMGLYLSPALIALGSSASAALMGGGIVAGGGIAALTVGLAGLGLVAGTVSGQIGKVQNAQEAYNLAVAQYGEGSKQAAAASARLYGVISTQGGRPTWDAVKAIQALKDEWRGATGGSRIHFLGMMTDGIKNLRRLLPTFAQETNMNMKSMRGAFDEAGTALSGADFKETISSLSGTFRSIIGPVMRGIANVIISLGRWLRASGPWVVRWANAWERMTFSWRRGSKDSDVLHGRISKLMFAAGAWWGLLKALGRTLKLIFRGSNEEGTELVILLTQQIDKFNEWLDRVEKSGELRGVFRSYINSLKSLVWSFQHPIQAINRYLPQVLDALAVAMAEAGPHAAALFWNTFWALGSWGKFFTIAFFLYKFGVLKKVGAIVGGQFALAFIGAFAPKAAAAIATGTAGTAIATAATAAGVTAGGVFAGAFAGAIALGVVGLGVIIAAKINREVEEFFGLGDTGRKKRDNPPIVGPTGPSNKPEGALPLIKEGGKWVWKVIGGQAGGQIPGTGRGDKVPLLGEPGEFMMRREAVSGYGLSLMNAINQGMVPKLAFGGVILPGMMAEFGDERGPEISIAAPKGGTIISPKRSGSASAVGNLQEPAIDVGGLVAPIHVHIEVDKREIARAYIDHRDARRSKRGER
jgi:hypothetical protein